MKQHKADIIYIKELLLDIKIVSYKTMFYKRECEIISQIHLSDSLSDNATYIFSYIHFIDVC